MSEQGDFVSSRLAGADATTKLKFNMLHAVVAELADAPDLGSGVFDVGVQVPSAAPRKKSLLSINKSDFFQ